VGPLGSAANLAYSGVIDSEHSVNMAFDVQGYVSEILQVRDAAGVYRIVSQGDPVTKGQVLAVIDSKPYRDQENQAKAQVAQAKAELSNAAAQLKRYRALLDQDAVAKQEFDAVNTTHRTAKAQLDNAQASLAQTQYNLKHTRLTAPMDGVVVQRNIDQGSFVALGQVAFTIGGVGDFKVDFSVPASIVGRIRQGMNVTMTTQAYPGKVFRATVSAVASAANESRVFMVQARVNDPDKKLRIGMVSAVSLGLEPDTGASVAVPLEAVVRPPGDPNGYAVYVVSAQSGTTGVAKLRKVTLGNVRGKEVAVISGVHPKERVIVSGASVVADGKSVTIIP